MDSARVGVTDKRLLRGARTRSIVLKRAVDIASLDGLEEISFGRLAADTGLSKAGIQTLFKTKETLQLAAVDYAREMFVDSVVQPAGSAPRGVARLWALLDNWAEYVSAPLFEGGCFRVANLAAFDSKTGPVHDALFRDQRAWLDALSAELRYSIDHGGIADLDVELAVFQIDALLCAANTALRTGDDTAVDKVRRIISGLLVAPPPAER